MHLKGDMLGQLARGITHLISLRLVLSLSAAGGAHGAASDVARRGVGRVVGEGRFWTGRSGDVRSGTGGVEVGQPSSPDSLIGCSPKSARMRHNTKGNVSTEWREEGEKGGEQTRMRPGMEQREKKKARSSLRKKKGSRRTIRTGVFSRRPR
jgi:hypothetical protein